MPGVAPGYANAQSPDRDKLVNAHHQDGQLEQMPRGNRGEGMALLELTDALSLSLH